MPPPANPLSRRPILLALAATATVLALSSIPGDIPAGTTTAQVVYFVPPAAQNLLHLPVYALLGWLWRGAFDRRMSRATLLAWVVVALVGIADETWQSLIPGRYPSFTDLSLDWAGALLGVAAHRYRQSAAAFSKRRT